MKFLNYDPKDKMYVCEVSHAEIEKHLRLKQGELLPFRPGEVVSLSRGPDIIEEIKASLGDHVKMLEDCAILLRKEL